MKYEGNMRFHEGSDRGMLGDVFDVFSKTGFFLKRVYYRLTRERMPDFELLKPMIHDKSGLEVGGPSRIFRDGGFIPLYHIVKTLDGCNFSNCTLWEGTIESGQKYLYYPNKVGTQYVLEASDLSAIESSKYEFLLSCNCLEHVANPLRAVGEWLRVLKEDGILILILPNKNFCFDHNRPVSTFAHLLEDFNNNTTEDDLTHLNEILELHDLELDKKAGTKEEFRERSLKNFENRALHQHVFDLPLLIELFDHFNLMVLQMHEGKDLIIIGKKNS